jgi:hypothetical protein
MPPSRLVNAMPVSAGFSRLAFVWHFFFCFVRALRVGGEG